MNPKAGAMEPQNIGPVYTYDPINWSRLIVIIVMLLALFVLVWAVWSGWKKRENITESRKIRKRLRFFAFAVAFAGIIDFLLGSALMFKMLAMTTLGETGKGIFNISMAESLYCLATSLGLSGLMFVVYLTMPWKKKTKEESSTTP
jgi:uncharacterized membrane protein YfcA